MDEQSPLLENDTKKSASTCVSTRWKIMINVMIDSMVFQFVVQLRHNIFMQVLKPMTSTILKEKLTKAFYVKFQGIVTATDLPDLMM